MCGRFTLSSPTQQLALQFEVTEAPSLEPRYNIAPTQPVATVRLTRDGSARELVILQWGLVPFWAKDPEVGERLINARAETLVERPAFREAYRRRRCLVLADGFYEWQKQDGTKQPYYVRMKNGKPFAFAGLWEHWKGPDTVVESCTLITTDPNDMMRPIHNRMPVILQPEDYELWLSREVSDPEVLNTLLKPYPSEEMTAFPVSRRVNSPDNDDARLIEPLPHGENLGLPGL